MPKRQCINIQVGPVARLTIAGGGQAIDYAKPG